MRQVQEEELSALLDGELHAERAQEVRALIAKDPALLRKFEAMVQLDGQFRELAQEAAFIPDISFPAWRASAQGNPNWFAGVGVVLALVAVRFLPRIVQLPLLGICIQIAACIAVCFAIRKMICETLPLRGAPID